MAASTYSYDGKLWKLCPTASDRNSFFHSAFGKRANENEAFYDKQAKFKRRCWGAFLTFYEDTALPSPLRHALTKSWSSIPKYSNESIDNPSSFEDYVSDVMSAAHDVVVGEIPIVAALENTEVVVLSGNDPKPIIIKPNVDILGDYSHNTKNKQTIVLCLEGNTFSRLEPLPSNDSSQTIHESDAEIPSDFSNCLLKYKKGSSAGSKGVEYQVGILTVFLLNAFQKLKNWKLSTENEAAGKFDDVVLEWHEGVILLQAKHKEKKSRKITLEDLLSTNTKNDDFSLPKYFLAYEGIKNKFKIKNLIICINAPVDAKISKYVIRHKVNGNSILYYGNENCTFYTFNDNIQSCLIDNVRTYYEKNYKNKGLDATVITEENIKQFLDHLQLYSSYPLKDDMMEVVESILSRMKQLRLLQGQISPTELYTKIMNWFQQKNGVYLTETYANAIFSEIRREIHCRNLEKYNVFFETNLDFLVSNRFHHITVKGGHLLQQIKVFQTLQKMKKNFLFVNLDDDVGELQQAVEAFKLPFYETLVLVWSETCEKSNVNRVCSVAHVLDKYKDQYKKAKQEIILITQSIEKLSSEIKKNCSMVKGTVTFKDFSKKTQTDLLIRNVIFQGNSFSLINLCGEQEIEWYEKALDADVLERLVRREEVKVGVQVSFLRKDISQFYINRTFRRAITQENYDESFRPNISEESFSEECLCSVNEKVIVISDVAGMGKSTVLAELAGLIKRQNPELWVIRINLNEYTRILSDCVRQNKQSITIEELLNSIPETKLKNGLENQIFSMQEKVVLMLDGVDEISPNYTTLMMGMIIECQKAQNFQNIFLTTRSHLIEVLVSELNVKPFNLQPFTENNQIDFFVKYWTHSLKLNEKEAEKCKQYAKELLYRLPSYWSMYLKDHFSAVPQYLQMLAEIFQETNSIENWQGCQEFVEMDNTKPELPDKMDLGRLYEKFIEKKRQLFLQRENPSGHPGADQALIDKFEECLVLHRNLALEIILDGSKCILFTSYKPIPKDNLKTMETIYKIGIVQKIGDSWHFVHRTFAEYFVAQSIIEELKCPNQNLEFQAFLIEKILIDRNYNVIRAFLNNFLNSVLVKLPADIFDRYKSVRSEIEFSGPEKFQVIHQLAREGCVAIFRLLFKCIKVETVESQSVKINEVYPTYGVENFSNVLEILETLLGKGGVNIEDKDGRTPLYYAVVSDRLEMVKFLVEEKNADIRVTDEDDVSISYWAISRHRQEIVRVLFNKMLKEGLNPNDSIAIYTAAYLGKLDVLKELVGRGANLNCRVEYNETPLFGAVRGRQLETVKYLVSQGVDVNVKNGKEILFGDRTALHVAVYRGFLDVVEVLVDCGAELDIEDIRGRTPLSSAASYGNLDIVKFLVDRGASPCYRNDTNYSRVMEVGVSRRHEDILEYLVGQGVDIILARGKKGRTQLHWAAYYGNLDMAKFITKFGVDVNVKDNKGNTALHWAALNNHKDIFELLVEHGADVNVKNNHRKTPLHYAAYNNHETIFTLLVEHGADVNAKNDIGRTPQDIFNAKNN